VVVAALVLLWLLMLLLPVECRIDSRLRVLSLLLLLQYLIVLGVDRRAPLLLRRFNLLFAYFGLPGAVLLYLLHA